MGLKAFRNILEIVIMNGIIIRPIQVIPDEPIHQKSNLLLLLEMQIMIRTFDHLHVRRIVFFYFFQESYVNKRQLPHDLVEVYVLASFA